MHVAGAKLGATLSYPKLKMFGTINVVTLKHEYLDLTCLILTILDHYLSISKVLDSISRRIPAINLTWVLT